MEIVFFGVLKKVFLLNLSSFVVRVITTEKVVLRGELLVLQIPPPHLEMEDLYVVVLQIVQGTIH